MPRNDVCKDNFIIKHVEVSHKYTGQNILLPEVGRGRKLRRYTLLQGSNNFHTIIIYKLIWITKNQYK